MPLKIIREMRDMPFIKRGMKIEVNGRPGRICSGNSSGNLNIRFDGEKFTRNCHPFYKTRYFGNDGQVIREYGDQPF